MRPARSRTDAPKSVADTAMLGLVCCLIVALVAAWNGGLERAVQPVYDDSPSDKSSAPPSLDIIPTLVVHPDHITTHFKRICGTACVDLPTPRSVTVSCGGPCEEAIDASALRRALVQATYGWPTSDRASLAPRTHSSAQLIISVVDAVREDDSGTPLFPQVGLISQ